MSRRNKLSTGNSILTAPPSAPAVRKELLRMLEESILPQARKGPRFIWGEPPLHVPVGVTVKPLKVPPLNEEGPGYHRLDRKWPELRVNSFHLPYIAFIFEGDADLRVGTTTSMAQALGVTPQDNVDANKSCEIKRGNDQRSALRALVNATVSEKAGIRLASADDDKVITTNGGSQQGKRVTCELASKLLLKPPASAPPQIITDSENSTRGHGVSKNCTLTAHGAQTNVNNSRVYGCHLLEIPAPTVIVFPPGVPYSDGSRAHWDRSYPASVPAQIFWMWIHPAEVLCHVSSNHGAQLRSGHSLRVKDPRLAILAEVLFEEMRRRDTDYTHVAQSLLLTLLLRLRRHIVQHTPIIGNTATYPIKDSPASRALNTDSSEQLSQFFESIDEYIRVHLQEPLSLRQLAGHVGLSHSHLNRLFRNKLGISVMRHVKRRRLEAACSMLAETDLSIKEIARLCGYPHPSHFCDIFHQTYQTTPRQFRRDHKSRVRRETAVLSR